MMKIEFPDMPMTMCAEDVAHALNISRSTAYELMHRRDFPSMQIGRRWIIARPLFEEWVMKQSTKKEPL